MNIIKKNVRGVLRLSRYQEHLGHTVILSSFAAIASQRIIDYKSAFVLFANILSITYAFMINDVEDVVEDSLDEIKRNRNPLSSGLLSKKHAVVITISTASTGLFFYYLGGIPSAVFGGSGLLFGSLYSLKIIRLKKYPLVDVVSHALFHAAFPFLAMYSLAQKGLTLDSTIPLSAFVLLSIASDLRNELRDEKLDTISGFKNTVSIIGREISRNLMIISRIVFPIILIVYIFFNFSTEARLILLTYCMLFMPLILLYSKTRKILLAYNQEVLHFLNGSMLMLAFLIFPSILSAI